MGLHTAMHVYIVYYQNHREPEASQHDASAGSIELIHPGCKLKPVSSLNQLCRSWHTLEDSILIMKERIIMLYCMHVHGCVHSLSVLKVSIHDKSRIHT